MQSGLWQSEEILFAFLHLEKKVSRWKLPRSYMVFKLHNIRWNCRWVHLPFWHVIPPSVSQLFGPIFFRISCAGLGACVGVNGCSRCHARLSILSRVPAGLSLLLFRVSVGRPAFLKEHRKSVGILSLSRVVHARRCTARPEDHRKIYERKWGRIIETQRGVLHAKTANEPSGNSTEYCVT